MKQKDCYVYMLTNPHHSVLYVGVTSNLEKCLYEHKNKLIKGFTSKYNVHKLVYCEHCHDIEAAIAREKEIKGWRRSKKNALISTVNPDWKEIGQA